MGKRFTDTEKWNDEWFRSLKPAYKCLWMYLCDRCDMSGVWKIDRGLADFQIGESIDWNSVFDKFGNRCVLIKEDRMFVVGFIDFQYGKLNLLSRPHQAVLKTLELHNITYPIDTLSIPHTKSIDTLKDKDKDKDKDKEQSKEEDCKEKQKTWRESFELYLVGCSDVYEHLLNNTPWIIDQERFYPNVDIKLSLEKAYKTFWGTEAGWKHKKKSRSKDLDWISTFTSAIGMNKVYKQRSFYAQQESTSDRLDRIFGENGSN